MTTIVYTAPGTLAGDRRISEDTLITRGTKIFRLNKQNVAIGVAGDYGIGLAFVEWYRGGQEGNCPLDKETDALVMNLDTGKCAFWQKGGTPIPIEEEFAAIGTGASVAFGALEWGADAKQAVETAALRDSSTGDGVNVIHKRKKRGAG